MAFPQASARANLSTSGNWRWLKVGRGVVTRVDQSLFHLCVDWLGWPLCSLGLSTLSFDIYHSFTPAHSSQTVLTRGPSLTTERGHPAYSKGGLNHVFHQVIPLTRPQLSEEEQRTGKAGHYPHLADECD